jgi:hypothetical protein
MACCAAPGWRPGAAVRQPEKDHYGGPGQRAGESAIFLAGAAAWADPFLFSGWL